MRLPMIGRRFLDVAVDLVRGTTEAHWRSAAGRAYYALLVEARDLIAQWGLSPPPRDKTHHALRHRFFAANDADLAQVSRDLEALGRTRNSADYDTALPGVFANDSRANDVIRIASAAITLLDAVNANP